MAVRAVRLGTRRVSGEGLRIGTVRRPPRGVPRRLFASQNRYDVWLPGPAPSRLLELLAALSRHADFSVGCYCEEESRCHRSILRELLRERGARI